MAREKTTFIKEYRLGPLNSNFNLTGIESISEENRNFQVQ